MSTVLQLDCTQNGLVKYHILDLMIKNVLLVQNKH